MKLKPIFKSKRFYKDDMNNIVDSYNINGLYPAWAKIDIVEMNLIITIRNKIEEIC